MDRSPVLPAIGQEASPPPETATARRLRFARQRAWYRAIERGLFRPRRNDGSVAIALLMVVVSIAAGPVTYLVTNHASRAAEIEDGRLHEAVERGYLQRTVQAQLEHEQRTFLAYARRDAGFRARSGDLSIVDVGVDREFAKQVEREQLLAVLGLFLWDTPEPDESGGSRYPVERVRTMIQEQLGSGRLAELEGSAASATARAQVERRTALWLVGLILALVGALLLLTAAQVTPRRWRQWFAVLGSLVALAAAAGVVIVDGTPVAWAIAIGMALLFALIWLGHHFAPALRRLLRRELQPQASAELLASDTGARGPTLFAIPDPGEMGTLFARAVALAIAAATLCGAWIGLLQADAFGRSDDWAFTARQYALEASNAGEQAENDVLFAIEGYGAATEAEARVWAAESLVRYLPTTASDAERRRAKDALDDARSVASSMARVGEVDAGDFGPSVDPTFPFGWFANASREHDRLTALQWLADADSREWENRGNFYVRWLVVLAIAVYLLGLAVVIPGQGVKVIFLVAGGSGVVVAAAVAMWTLLNHPRSAVDGAADRASVAAESYADGRYRSAIGDTEGAVEALKLTVERRPDFGQAHADLASAFYQEGSKQTATYISVSRPEAVVASIEQLQAAERNGIDGFSVEASLGWERLLASLQSTDPPRQRALVDASLAASGAAISRNPRHPVPFFNLALANLALGDNDAADVAYAEAIHLTRGTPEEPALVDRLTLLGASLTDLELLRRFRPDLAGAADTHEDTLVRELSGPQPSTGEAPNATTVTPSLLPTTLVWSARLPGLDPATDSVVQVWYERDDRDDPWKVHGNPETLEVDGDRASGRAVLFQEPDSSYSGEIDVAVKTATCLSDGQYRVDLYVNGVRVAHSREITRINSDSPDVGASGWWARDIGLMACVPPGWLTVAGDDHEPGQVDGVVSPDGSSGLVFARIRIGDAVVADGSVDAVLESIRRSGIGVIPAGLERDPDSNGRAFYLGSSEDRTQVWRSSGSEYRAQAGLTKHGTVLVAILFGPTGFLATDDARLGPIGSSYVQMDERWGIRPPAPSP